MVAMDAADAWSPVGARHLSLLPLVMVVQAVDADLFGAPKKWHGFSQVRIFPGEASSTAYLLQFACNVLSHLSPTNFTHLPKNGIQDQRQGQPEAHRKTKEKQIPLERSSVTAHPHEQAITSSLIVFLWHRGTSCVSTSPGRAFIYSPLKGLNSSGRGRSCAVRPPGLPNLSHLRGESRYKEGFPLLSQSTFSHFNVSFLFGSYCC